MSSLLVKSDQMRSAVVTGAGRGIGRAIAAELATRGFRVVVTDLDAEAAYASAKEVGGAIGIGLDVTDAMANRDVAARARDIAPLGAWVCNAGVGFDGDLTALSSSQIRTLVDVNLLGPVWGARAAIDVFRSQAATGVLGGELGLTASLSAHGPVPGLSMYAATKAALLSLATSLDSELKDDGIGVHAICPDGVDTQMVREMQPQGRARALIAAGAFYTPEQVAKALVDMFGTRRVYRTLPAWRGALMRAAGFSPSTFMGLEPTMRKVGLKKLTRAGLRAESGSGRLESDA